MFHNVVIQMVAEEHAHPPAVKDLHTKFAPAHFTLLPKNNSGPGCCLIQPDTNAVLHISLVLRKNSIHLSVSIKISEGLCDCFIFCICCILPAGT